MRVSMSSLLLFVAALCLLTPIPALAQAELFENNAASTLATAIDTDDTEVVVQSGHGALFPAITGSDFFFVTLDAGATREIVKVTSRSTDTLTVVRAQQGTSAASWSTGAKVEQRLTSETLENFRQKTVPIVDADVPNTITIDLATAASALAANPSDCSANQFANAIAASGNLTCAALADGDVPNTITLDNLTQITTRAIADTTGTLAVARGGTNLTASADDNVMVGNGTTWETKALADCDNGTTSKLLYDTATNTFSCGTDQTGAASTPPEFTRLAADSALSTTTKTNLSGMSYTLSANTNYSWHCHFFTTANAATVGVQFQITFGGTVTAVRGMFQGPGAATTLLWISDTTFPLDFNPTASQGNVAGGVVLSGTVEVSGTGGTLQFLHGSETATLTTVQRGSWCELAENP